MRQLALMSDPAIDPRAAFGVPAEMLSLINLKGYIACLRLGCELRQPCQTGRHMALHFPAGTTYRVVLRRDRTYGVELSKAKSTPFIVNGFRTEVEADGWIKFQRLRTKERDA
jgi:hypothetical protein